MGISYQVRITDTLPAGVTQVSNQGEVSSNELPIEPTDDPDTPTDDDRTETNVIAAPDIEAYKTDSLYTDADGNGVFLIPQKLIRDFKGKGEISTFMRTDLDSVDVDCRVVIGRTYPQKNPLSLPATRNIGALDIPAQAQIVL